MLRNLQNLEGLAMPTQPSLPNLPIADVQPPLTTGLFSTMLRKPMAFAPDIQQTSELLKLMYQVIDHIALDAKELSFARTASRIKRLREHVDREQKKINEFRDNQLRHELKYLREAMEDDLYERIIFFPDQNRASLYNQSQPFGEEVFNAFEHLRKDVTAASSCLATDNYTACVFHLMRIVEASVRGLARRFSVTVKRPMEYEDWIKIAQGLNKKLEHLRNNARSARRQKELEFYSDAAERCQFFKELWRDSVMHSRKHYEEWQAIDTFQRVRHFVTLLASRKRTRNAQP